MDKNKDNSNNVEFAEEMNNDKKRKKK